MTKNFFFELISTFSSEDGERDDADTTCNPCIVAGTVIFKRSQHQLLGPLGSKRQVHGRPSGCFRTSLRAPFATFLRRPSAHSEEHLSILGKKTSHDCNISIDLHYRLNWTQVSAYSLDGINPGSPSAPVTQTTYEEPQRPTQRNVSSTSLTLDWQSPRDGSIQS